MAATSYTLAKPSPSSGSSCASITTPTVLLLSGWTPGPINYLRTRLQNDNVNVVEPRLLMPPWRGMWCWDLNFCLMCGVCLGLIWALYTVIFQYHEHFGDDQGPKRILYVSILLGTVTYWIRLMVAVVCRSAIADGVEQCLREMRGKNVVLCVGFSWGAGVLSELLTRDAGLDTQPAFLLMAPVSSATAVAAMREDAALRLHALENNDFVTVVHASDDPVFCPHPERWEQVSEIKNYTINDIHLFKHLSSRRTLAEIMTTLFRSKTEGGIPGNHC